MTRQEAFDQVVRGLASQGWRWSLTTCGDGSETCAYRGDHGRRCAMGWLIPDDDYLGECSMKIYLSRLREVWPNAEVDVLQFQRMHDNSLISEEMEKTFRMYADEHGLLWPLEVASNDRSEP